MSSNKLKFDFNYEILPDNFTQYDISFKIIIIGDSGVGKSCLTTKATKNIFEDSYNATIGFEFFSFNIKLEEKIIKLQIWDTCGQELYRALITNFYRNSSLAVVVYSVTDKDSFENIDLWCKELRTNSNPNVKIFLIGNKIDLENQRKIKTEDGQKYAEQYNFHKFIETSAKTGFNAQGLFIEAAKILYDDYIKFHRDDDFRGSEDYDKNSEKNPRSNLISNRSSLISNNKEEKKKGCC